MTNPPLLANIVPRRNASYIFIFLGGVAIILLLGALYAVGLSLSHLTSDGKVAAFDLDGEGSIASWFSITLLTLCGLVTLLIRTLRVAAGCTVREGGLWLPLATFWFAMSLDEGACLHEGFKEVMVKLTGSRIMGDGSIYWAVPYFLLLSAAGVFLLYVGRRDHSVLLLLSMAGASYGLAAAGQLELVLVARPILETWLEESCEMFADLCVLCCLMRYARSLAYEKNANGHAPTTIVQQDNVTPRQRHSARRTQTYVV